MNFEEAMQYEAIRLAIRAHQKVLACAGQELSGSSVSTLLAKRACDRVDAVLVALRNAELRASGQEPEYLMVICGVNRNLLMTMRNSLADDVPTVVPLLRELIAPDKLEWFERMTAVAGEIW